MVGKCPQTVCLLCNCFRNVHFALYAYHSSPRQTSFMMSLQTLSTIIFILNLFATLNLCSGFDYDCATVPVGRTDGEQIRSRINNNDCRTFRQRRPLSTAYVGGVSAMLATETGPFSPFPCRLFLLSCDFHEYGYN